MDTCEVKIEEAEKAPSKTTTCKKPWCVAISVIATVAVVGLVLGLSLGLGLQKNDDSDNEPLFTPYNIVLTMSKYSLHSNETTSGTDELTLKDKVLDVNFTCLIESAEENSVIFYVLIDNITTYLDDKQDYINAVTFSDSNEPSSSKMEDEVMKTLPIVKFKVEGMTITSIKAPVNAESRIIETATNLVFDNLEQIISTMTTPEANLDSIVSTTHSEELGEDKEDYKVRIEKRVSLSLKEYSKQAQAATEELQKIFGAVETTELVQQNQNSTKAASNLGRLLEFTRTEEGKLFTLWNIDVGYRCTIDDTYDPRNGGSDLYVKSIKPTFKYVGPKPKLPKILTPSEDVATASESKTLNGVYYKAKLFSSNMQQDHSKIKVQEKPLKVEGSTVTTIGISVQATLRRKTGGYYEYGVNTIAKIPAVAVADFDVTELGGNLKITQTTYPIEISQTFYIRYDKPGKVTDYCYQGKLIRWCWPKIEWAEFSIVYKQEETRKVGEVKVKVITHKF